MAPALPNAGFMPALNRVAADHPPGVTAVGAWADASGWACGCSGVAAGRSPSAGVGGAVDVGAGSGVDEFG